MMGKGQNLVDNNVMIRVEHYLNDNKIWAWIQVIETGA